MKMVKSTERMILAKHDKVLSPIILMHGLNETFPEINLDNDGDDEKSENKFLYIGLDIDQCLIDSDNYGVNYFI